MTRGQTVEGIHEVASLTRGRTVNGLREGTSLTRGQTFEGIHQLKSPTIPELEFLSLWGLGTEEE
jgi:hypothetical protein